MSGGMDLGAEAISIPVRSGLPKWLERPIFRIRNGAGLLFDVSILKLLSAVDPASAARWINHRFWLRPRRFARSSRELEILKGADARLRDYDGKHIATFQWGSGPTVLLVHGWNGRGSQFSEFVVPLVEKGFRVLTFDAPGHGYSKGSQTDFPEIAGLVRRLATAFGPLHGMVCHSAGCVSSLLACQEHCSVKRIACISPFASLDTPLRGLHRQLKLPPIVVSRHRQLLEALYGPNLYETYSPASIVTDLEVPGLVIHDDNDREVPAAEGEALARAWGARFVNTQSLGHYRVLRDRHVVDLVVNFIADA